MGELLDQLREDIPQHIAARLGAHRQFGRVTLIACRPAHVSSERLLELTPQEYDVLLLSAQGLSLTQVSAEIGRSAKDPRARALHHMKTESDLEAYLHIPLTGKQLDKTSLTLGPQGVRKPVFGPQADTVFELLGGGLSDEEIANEIASQKDNSVYSKETAARHRGRIAAQLGIQTKRGQSSAAMVARLSGAWPNWVQHSDDTQLIATELQHKARAYAQWAVSKYGTGQTALSRLHVIISETLLNEQSADIFKTQQAQVIAKTIVARELRNFAPAISGQNK